MESEDHKRIIPPWSTIHLHCGSSTISVLYCRSWTGNCTGDVHSRTKGRHTFPLQLEVYNLFRQQCQRSRNNYRYKEIEEGESSNSLATWAKCKGLKLLVRNAETNFGRQSLSHHYVPVSTRRMLCKSCQRKWRRKLIARQLPSRKGQMYHLAKNDYRFDALQIYCFGFNIKL